MNAVCGKAELDRISRALRRRGIAGSAHQSCMAVVEQLQIESFSYRTRPVPYSLVDRSHQDRGGSEKDAGHVPECCVAGCDYLCCDVGVSGANTIWLHRSEIEGLNDDRSHLTIVGETGSSCRAVCNLRAGGCGCGKGNDGRIGYKPVDCRDYPWLRNLSNGIPEFWVGSGKCPMPAVAKLRHLPAVLHDFVSTLAEHPSRVPEYEGVHRGMVGYKRFDSARLDRLGVDEIETLLDAGMALELDDEVERIRLAEVPVDPERAMRRYRDALELHHRRAMRLVRMYGGIRLSHFAF